MLIHLFSDANYNLLGFNATYTFSVCPGACGGHGRCDSSTSKCHCHQGWGGASCTIPLCSQACSMNGQCDKVTRRGGIFLWPLVSNLLPFKYLSLQRKPTVNHSVLLLFYNLFCFRKENAVSVTQASLATAVSLVSAMITGQESGGVWVRETQTHLPGLVLLACTCPQREPCICLEVGVSH